MSKWVDEGKKKGGPVGGWGKLEIRFEISDFRRQKGRGRTSWDRGVGRETEGGPLGGANFGGRWGSGKERG